MNCSETLEKLDDYLDGDLDAVTCAAVQAHLGACARCRARGARARELMVQLRELPVPPAPAGFRNRVLQRAQQAHRHAHALPGRNGWLAAALAASLFAGVGIGLLVARGGPETVAVQPVAIVLEEQRTVQLVFSAGRDVGAATFTVVLPEGVELVGFPGRREISWQGSLRSGANLLRLRLVAHSTGGGALVARVREGDRSKTFSVELEVRVPQHTDGSAAFIPA